MVDKLLYYIHMRKVQLRIEAERGESDGYTDRRWGLIEGERNALNDMEELINEYKNREMGK